MGIFNDNITNSTPLHQLHDRWKNIIEKNFAKYYVEKDGDLSHITTIFNGMLRRPKIQEEFINNGIYLPYFNCQCLVDDDFFKCMKITIKVTIFYSEDPTIYTQDQVKTFLSMNIKIPLIKPSNYNNYEYICK